jgi:hypothetical protein
MLVKLIYTLVLISASAGLPPSERPRCTKENRGMVWPPESARDACSEVEVCTFHVWNYRWDAVTVHVSQLAKNKRRRTACRTPEAPQPSVARKP